MWIRMWRPSPSRTPIKRTSFSSVSTTRSTTVPVRRSSRSWTAQPSMSGEPGAITKSGSSRIVISAMVGLAFLRGPGVARAMGRPCFEVGTL
ncbi:hypothetical protein D3C86_1264010 [compost metagenome]